MITLINDRRKRNGAVRVVVNGHPRWIYPGCTVTVPSLSGLTKKYVDGGKLSIVGANPHVANAMAKDSVKPKAKSRPKPKAKAKAKAKAPAKKQPPAKQPPAAKAKPVVELPPDPPPQDAPGHPIDVNEVVGMFNDAFNRRLHGKKAERAMIQKLIDGGADRVDFMGVVQSATVWPKKKQNLGAVIDALVTIREALA